MKTKDTMQAIKGLQKRKAETALTAGEVKTFTKNCNELLEYVQTYGLPSPSSCLIPEFQMAARLRGIRNRPELLIIAKQIDTKGILFN